ncbi:MAG: stage III sporulation protein AF [bacterium]|nr:stage III sporulation protein AF [bacterium]MCM1375996.1 stage III sporulation protein AF [Muribaculum sp.]
MWEGLLGSIRQMGVFMICAQALIHFKPKGSYEKYLKLLVSAMLLVQLLSPIAALLSGRDGLSLEERIAQYSESFEQGMGEATMQEYRIDQLRESLLEAQLETLGIPLQETAAAGSADQEPCQETGEINIQIDPVVIEMSQGGLRDMEQMEEEHGREDKEPDGKMAEEG